MESLLRKSLQEVLRREAGSSGTTFRGAGANSEPALKVTNKDRDEPVLRNLPELITRTPLSGVSSSDTPLQGASSSSTSTGDGVRHLA
jgi:hypothetical protein